jgi:hypothetical protein
MSGFTIIPDGLIDDDRLNHATLAVLIALRSFAWTHEAGCTASILKIAKRARLSERTVKRAIKALKTLGYIERIGEHKPEKGRQLPNQVILTAQLYNGAQPDTHTDGARSDTHHGAQPDAHALMGRTLTPYGAHGDLQSIYGEAERETGYEETIVGSRIERDPDGAHTDPMLTMTATCSIISTNGCSVSLEGVTPQG